MEIYRSRAINQAFSGSFLDFLRRAPGAKTQMVNLLTKSRVIIKEFGSFDGKKPGLAPGLLAAASCVPGTVGKYT